jgi:hypothetical protein
MISNTANISKEEVQLLKQNKARIVDNDSCLEFNQQELRRLDAICKWIKLNKDYELKIDSTNKNRQAIMALPWDSSFDAVELRKRLSMIEYAIKEIDKGIKLIDELLVIRTYCVAMLKPLKEEIERTRESFIKDRAFFIERQNTIKIQVEFITQADKKSKPHPKPRYIKSKVNVEKRYDQSHPYSEELTRMVYDYCVEEQSFNVCWDVFNNAVMSSNYSQLNVPSIPKANLCHLIHLFDVYICGGIYGHLAALSIGLDGRSKLTQQAANLAQDFREGVDLIFQKWAKQYKKRIS